MILFLFILFCFIHSKKFVATVYYDPEPAKVRLEIGKYDCEKGIACAIFYQEINQDGWDKINITTNRTGRKNIPEGTFGYAAGLLEGALCWEEIYAIFTNHNHYWGWADEPIPVEVMEFMQENLAWVRMQVKSNPKDFYWHQVGLIVSQFDGMLDGYLSQCDSDKKLSEMNLFFLQSAGDLYGVLTKFNSEVFGMGLDCSGLIKLVPSPDGNGFSDVYIGQDTWRSFGLQNKFFKFYNFDYDGVAAKSIAFASSPGFISSKDDYYQTDAGLVILETTNSIFDASLAQWVHPETVFTWIRSPLSARLASDGSEWISMFSKFYSATYTNQWMILDWKKFQNNQLQDGFFHILEEIPSLIVFQDMTQYLENHEYWPSYNVPYFNNIYNLSGYTKEYGPDYYKECPRSLMFEELVSSILDFERFQYVMRYNHYKTDPNAKGDPANGIMSRFDLRGNKTHAKAFGGIDSKLTKFSLRKNLGQYIVAGPTHASDQTPPFKWTEQFKDTVHIGQPELYNFDWIEWAMDSRG